MTFSRESFFYPAKNSLFIYTRLFENLKARILKSIITWSEMEQQTVQAKEVYYGGHFGINTSATEPSFAYTYKALT